MNTAPRAIAISPSSLSVLLRDYAELTKLRVTSMIVLTAWTGFYFAAFKSGVSGFSWTLFHALIGIGLVSGGTAGFNEVIECDTDSHMRRTAMRPLPAKRMGLTHASIVCSALIIGGATYLWLATNALTASAHARHRRLLPRRLHSVETRLPHLHVHGSVLRRHASGSRLDRPARPR